MDKEDSGHEYRHLPTQGSEKFIPCIGRMAGYKNADGVNRFGDIRLKMFSDCIYFLRKMRNKATN